MTGGSLSRRHDRISVKHRHNPSRGAFFELADFNYTNISSGENDKSPLPNSDAQSSETLSTTELISTVGNVWNRAKEPLSRLLPKTNSAIKPEFITGGDILYYSNNEDNLCISKSTEDQSSPSYQNGKTNSTKLGQGDFKYSKVKKVSSLWHSYENCSFGRISLANSSVIDGFNRKSSCVYNAGTPSKLGCIYGWMSEVAFRKPNNQENSKRAEGKSTINRHACDCSPIPESGSADLTFGTSCNLEPAETIDKLYSEIANFDLKASSTTCLENKIVHSQNVERSDHEIYISRFDKDVQDTAVASCRHDSENGITKTDDGLCGHQKNQGIAFVRTNIAEVDIGFSEKKRPQYAFAKQEHAFAGAMAGVFVSLCLHPIDTVKTVIQSCRADQKPLHHIGRSILSERGIIGLYRGISSNILTSAPISALYTFTYESVKKSLLPFLPKEYHSLAHCTAGGCASIATSFIFTPSERIKQQMQIGSHYRNCWNALIEVLEKGGVRSLYAGWGAVLCRNVPHSIIKFYSYESLKQIMLPSTQSDAEPSTSVTLVCGGLAGSTASLFTTPLDVVKTRLQTQIPGSPTRYKGVIDTLRDVRKHEGLKGLYKGLTPRLVMYMIQGALFFASYESFKTLLSLEIPQLTQTLRHERKIEDDSLSTVSSVAA